jgi:hypothetical protein
MSTLYCVTFDFDIGDDNKQYTLQVKTSSVEDGKVNKNVTDFENGIYPDGIPQEYQQPVNALYEFTGYLLDGLTGYVIFDYVIPDNYFRFRNVSGNTTILDIKIPMLNKSENTMIDICTYFNVNIELTQNGNDQFYQNWYYNEKDSRMVDIIHNIYGNT